MKKYYFTWFNHTKEHVDVGFILANDLEHAKLVACKLMNISTGFIDYNTNDINIIEEIPSLFYTEDDIDYRYKCIETFTKKLKNNIEKEEDLKCLKLMKIKEILSNYSV